jgi:hypothetical protein
MIPPLNLGMLTFLKSVASEQNQYEAFKKTLPPNLRNSSEDEYDMKYYWQNMGKPKDFTQAQSYEQPMFSLEKDKFYHAPSVEPNTLRFLKPPTHPTIQKELNWYKSNDPKALDFRSKYDIDKSGKFYKYVPKNK